MLFDFLEFSGEEKGCRDTWRIRRVPGGSSVVICGAAGWHPGGLPVGLTRDTRRNRRVPGETYSRDTWLFRRLPVKSHSLDSRCTRGLPGGSYWFGVLRTRGVL